MWERRENVVVVVAEAVAFRGSPLATLDFSPFEKVLVHIQNYLVPQAGSFLPSPPPFRTSDLIDETSGSLWKMVVVRGE